MADRSVARRHLHRALLADHSLPTTEVVHCTLDRPARHICADHHHRLGYWVPPCAAGRWRAFPRPAYCECGRTPQSMKLTPSPFSGSAWPSCFSTSCRSSGVPSSISSSPSRNPYRLSPPTLRSPPDRLHLPPRLCLTDPQRRAQPPRNLDTSPSPSHRITRRPRSPARTVTLLSPVALCKITVMQLTDSSLLP